MVLTQAKVTEFYTDLERGSSGIIKHGVKMPRNTFGMKLMIMVEADAYTGYYAEVVRELDRKHGYVQCICYIPASLYARIITIMRIIKTYAFVAASV